MKQIHLIISGHVQGVFFRHNTNIAANKLGLKGYVKNLSNGCVEVIAQGPEDKIKQLLAFCREGPENANVKDVKITYEEPSDMYETFSIKY